MVSSHEGQELRVYTVKASDQGNQDGEFHADSDGDPGASRVSSSAEQAAQRDDSIHDHVDDSAYRKTAGAEMLSTRMPDAPSPLETMKDIPVRTRQTRTRTSRRESPPGLLCQAETTSWRPPSSREK